MPHPDASNASSGDSESDCIIVSDHQPSPSPVVSASINRGMAAAAVPTPTPPSSTSGREDHANFVLSFPPLETARTTTNASDAAAAAAAGASASAAAAPAASGAGAGGGGAAAAAAGAAAYGYATIQLGKDDSRALLDTNIGLVTPRWDSSVKTTAVVGRTNVVIDGRGGTERGGGGGGGGGGRDSGGRNGVGGSIVAVARSLPAPSSSCSQEEEEEEEEETPREENDKKRNGLPFYRNACDFCSKRKRKCSGQQPCSQCASMERRNPNIFCVYSPRQTSGRKKKSHISQGRTEVVSCEGSNPGQRSEGCQTMDADAGLMVQIKPEGGGPAVAGYDVTGEYEEGRRRPPAAATSKGGLPPSRGPKAQTSAEVSEPAAEPTAAERDVAASLGEAARCLRRVQLALSTDSTELRRRREAQYKRLRAELASEKSREDRDVYFIEYLETQLREARQALSAPPEVSSNLSPAPPHSP